MQQCASSCARPGAVPLLPDHLYWAPEAKTPVATGGCQELQALDLCKHAGGKVTTYGVAHYHREACGAAFGPLSLSALLHFCRGLDEALKRGAVALTTPRGDRATRLNALAMLGGYMIGKYAWSAEKLTSTIGADAEAKFVCSWSVTETPEPERVMTVRDVWSGLEKAFRCGWLSPSCIEDDEKLEAAVTRYRLRAMCFDATWIIPGMLMVASDPTTVVFDPNPATCKRMVPPNAGEVAFAMVEENESGSRGLSIDIPSATKQDTIGSTTPSPTSPKSPKSSCTLDTVCKEYNLNYEDSMPSDPSLIPEDYASFLMQNSVGIIVRANFDQEQGMPRASYRDDTFKPFGIEQANVRIVDTNGGLPKPEDVARVIEVCDSYLDGSYLEHPAVMVHCKGGFGRSVVLAACLAIHRYDLPGSALLGWARVTRPGAITTRKQELFLKGLRGRTDVMAYAKIPLDPFKDSSTSCTSCSLQ